MKKREIRMNDTDVFNLPTYKEIPSVGLYLDQTSKYINEVLLDLPDAMITNSMISNYVKKHLIANPIKKQYGREQIACLIFIAVTKSALSLDDVKNFFDLQKNKYSIEEAYTYFAGRFDKILNENEILKIKPEEKEKALLENIILTVVSNIHLHKLLEEAFGNKV